MILTRDLVKSFGPRRVLRGLDLAVDPSAITLLVGANGAGKTTTLRLLSGLADPDAGAIEIAGHDLRCERKAALERLSFLPQAPRFHPRLTTFQTAEFYARLRGRSRRDAEAALDRWGMLEHAAVPTGKLSGGLRQRLALAVFSVAEAPVLILDEPGLSLDPEWRESLQEHLVDAAARGCTVLVATHLLGEWEGRAHRCVLVEHGRSQGELPPDALRRAFPRLALAS
jgi:ABC-type multidrug transport system ATPase subunit